jgi:hypothetical protein
MHLSALRGFGDIDATAIVALGYDTITVDTNATGPVAIPISAMGGPPDPATQALMQQLQPAITISGRAPTIHVAPYGDPPGGVSGYFKSIGWKLGAGIGLGMIGLVLLGGAIFSVRAKRQAPRVAGYGRHRTRRRKSARRSAA